MLKYYLRETGIIPPEIGSIWCVKRQRQVFFVRVAQFSFFFFDLLSLLILAQNHLVVYRPDAGV